MRKGIALVFVIGLIIMLTRTRFEADTLFLLRGGSGRRLLERGRTSSNANVERVGRFAQCGPRMAGTHDRGLELNACTCAVSLR